MDAALANICHSSFLRLEYFGPRRSMTWQSLVEMTTKPAVLAEQEWPDIQWIFIEICYDLKIDKRKIFEAGPVYEILEMI
jgi:hypothetical protein